MTDQTTQNDQILGAAPPSDAPVQTAEPPVSAAPTPTLIDVTVGIIPGNIHSVQIKSGTTVAEAFNKAGLNLSSTAQLTVDGEQVSPHAIITKSCSILATRPIRGNG